MSAKVFHKKAVPAFYAVMWFFGLLFSIKAKEIFHVTNENIILVLSLTVIFSVFFLELIVMLIDLYSKSIMENSDSGGAKHLSMSFVLIMCAILFIVIFLFIYIIVFVIHTLENNTGNTNLALVVILIASTILKYIEIFVQNNSGKYIYSYEQLQAGATYEKRNLSF